MLRYACDNTNILVSSWEYWSAKDQAYAFKYEVVVSLSPNQRIVRVEGPIKGVHSDLTIFRHHLKKSLTSGEKLIADQGYIGEPNHLLTARRNNTRNPKEQDELSHEYKLNSFRQGIERVHKQMKHFNAAGGIWRGDDVNNGKSFHVICKKQICCFKKISL